MPFSDLIFPLDKHLTLPKVPVNRLSCVWLSDLALTETTSQWAPGLLPLSRSELLEAAVKSSGFLTDPCVEKPAFYLNLTLKEKVDCLPGDTIGVYVKNDEDKVKTLLERLKINGDLPCKIEGTIPSHLPANQPTTPFFILSQCVDLETPMKKVSLAMLAQWAEGNEVRKLQELASREAPSSSEVLTLPFLLDLLPSLAPDFSAVLAILSPFKPRPYSVANFSIKESTQNGTSLRIALSLVEGGLASAYLHNMVLQQSDLSRQFASVSLDDSTQGFDMVLPVYLRKRNDFITPKDILSSPVIMVATGTGIAPFIGMLEHREYNIEQKKNSDSNNICHVDVAPWYLIYGCRDEAHELFKSEVNQFTGVGALKKYFPCFSRNPISEGPKYVQDCLLQERDLFVPLLLDDKTVMMICGDGSKMVPSVKSAVADALQLSKNFSKEEAVAFVSDAVKSKRIIFDSWVL